MQINLLRYYSTPDLALRSFGGAEPLTFLASLP